LIFNKDQSIIVGSKQLNVIMVKPISSSDPLLISGPAKAGRPFSVAGPIFLILGGLLLTAGSLGFAHVFVVVQGLAIAGIVAGGLTFLYGVSRTRKGLRTIPEEAVQALLDSDHVKISRRYADLERDEAYKMLQNSDYHNDRYPFYAICIDGDRFRVEQQEDYTWYVRFY
jgi:hypothetical protein